MTGSQSHLKNKAVKLNIDYSHFLGKAKNKGRIFGPKRNLKHYTENGNFITSAKLRNRLIADGVKEHKCEVCGISKWLNEDAPLELDHINRNHLDNSLANLQIICPNCHALKTARDRKLRKKS